MSEKKCKADSYTTLNCDDICNKCKYYRVSNVPKAIKPISKVELLISEYEIEIDSIESQRYVSVASAKKVKYYREFIEKLKACV